MNMSEIMLNAVLDCASPFAPCGDMSDGNALNDVKSILLVYAAQAQPCS